MGAVYLRFKQHVYHYQKLAGPRYSGKQLAG